MKYCCHVILAVICIRTSPNPKPDDLSSVSMNSASSFLSAFLTMYIGRKISNICKQHISVPTTIKKMSVARFCIYRSLLNGLHSQQTTNPD